MKQYLINSQRSLLTIVRPPLVYPIGTVTTVNNMSRLMPKAVYGRISRCDLMGGTLVWGGADIGAMFGGPSCFFYTLVCWQGIFVRHVL